jgi:hypothetical protein
LRIHRTTLSRWARESRARAVDEQLRLRAGLCGEQAAAAEKEKNQFFHI